MGNQILTPPLPPFDGELVGVELLVVGNVLHDKDTKWGAGEQFKTYPHPAHQMAHFLGGHLEKCLKIWDTEKRIKKSPLPFETRHHFQVGRIVWMTDDLLRIFLLALYRREITSDERARILTWIFEKKQEQDRKNNKSTDPERFQKIQEKEKERILPDLIKMINEKEQAKNWYQRLPLELPEEREMIGELMTLLHIDDIFGVCHPN